MAFMMHVPQRNLDPDQEALRRWFKKRLFAATKGMHIGRHGADVFLAEALASSGHDTKAGIGDCLN